MPNLIFIRHSQSQLDPETPSRLWKLTEEGRRRCKLLAAHLIPYELDVIITSAEPKAIETGKLVAQRLGIPCRVMENLHEHERETAPFFDTQEEFLEAITNLFAKPTKLVYGDETAIQAQKRFTAAVESVIAAYPQENIAIVTHGTVLSLFASQHTGIDVYSFWRGLGLPALVAFSHPEMKLLAQVNQIE
jgi:broad specificity phosphatase PhoE